MFQQMAGWVARGYLAGLVQLLKQLVVNNEYLNEPKKLISETHAVLGCDQHINNITCAFLYYLFFYILCLT